MYRVDLNNAITRISDGKVIVRDISNVEYQTFLYVQNFRVDPQTHGQSNVFTVRGDK